MAWKARNNGGRQETMVVGNDAEAPRIEGEPARVLVETREVEHYFFDGAGRATPALTKIDLQVTAGEFLAIVGPSGCGKTTLLNLIAGMIRPSRGQVFVNGSPPRTGNSKLGYLFARDALLPWRTVLDNAELNMELFGVAKHERRQRARKMLDGVGLSLFMSAYPAQLSQGMRQRVAIARTMAPMPEILLLDEPFSALDAQTKMLLQDAFSELWQQVSATVILITHDLREAVAMADRVVILSARPGRIKKTLDVDLPRPRSVVQLQSDQRYDELYEEAWESLREEVI
ncbi:MAG: ABC transporter ATP-binding protein [Haloechinothrix sp.]